MGTWPKRIGSIAALTIGLIACFAPGDDDVVDAAAARLPMDTPMLWALAEPDLLLSELAQHLDNDALSPEAWTQVGLDPTRPMTLARWPGPNSFWVISCAVDDDALAEAGFDDLLSTLTAAHRLVLDGDRAHVLVSMTAPEPEAWRAAARALEVPDEVERLVHDTKVERLGQDDLMVAVRVEGAAELLALPVWAQLLMQGLDVCTLRASGDGEGWRGALTCPTDEASALHGLLRSDGAALEPLGLDLEGALQLAISTERLVDLWGEWADDDAAADEAHTTWLDLAQRADISPSSFWSEAMTGEVTLSVNRWPIADRRPGVMAVLGVEEDGRVARVLEAARGILDDLPGVRLEPERIRGIEGWRAEWLRYRGQDLSWAQSDGRLWLAYGSADLDDAVAEVSEPQWEVEDGPGSGWVDVGLIMGLESVLQALEVTLAVDGEGVALRGHLTRPDSASSAQAVAGVLGWVQDDIDARREAALMTQLGLVCDAVDLYAIDHGLPGALAELSARVNTLDPWGHRFDYARPATRRPHHRYDLCSRGPDGVPETSDDICYE
ncbi:MAG: type II secretion system protein GspG [Myxococcota bacterium]